MIFLLAWNIKLVKTLNQLILSYLLGNYSINSTSEFFNILESNKANDGIIASLVFESLFTNYPVKETIDIVLQSLYNHSLFPPPEIRPTILQRHAQHKYLSTITMATFTHKLMSLQWTHTNFYMTHVADKVFTNFTKTPYMSVVSTSLD